MVLKKHIPHELVVEILSWLPAKHLWQFRFVSKTWFQLITANPRFANLHFERSKNNNPNPSILVWRPYNNAILYSTDYTSCNKTIGLEVPSIHDTYVCGVSNGLLSLYRNGNKEVYIFNPLTNDSITISCLPTPSPPRPGYLNCTIFGFGFDHHSNKYKFIRFFCEYGNLKYNDYHYSQVSVYTVGMDSMWRMINEDLLICPIRMPNVVVSGALHWVTCKPLVYTPWKEIVAFDLKDEVIRKMTVPNDVVFGYTIVNKIVELGGLLCMIKGHFSKDIDIWAMEEYGVVTSWSKKFRIERPDTHNNSHFCYVLGIARNGEIILNRGGKNLILYNLETKSVVELARFQFSLSGAYSYVESIISPRFIT